MTVAHAQPVVTQISNAASASLSVLAEVTSIHVDGTWLSLPNASIAQGSYFSVYGSSFGADSTVCGANYSNCFWNPYPLPTSIQGTSVNVTVGSTTVAAYIEFAAQTSATSSQINAVLPSTTPVGTGTLTVTYNGQTSTPVPIMVSASSFGTFSWNQSGGGPGIITDVNYSLLTYYHTAKPGDYVILWGTGLGPAPNIQTEGTERPPQTNLCSTPSTCPVTVWVGGKQATVPYAGRSGYTAEDQVIFIVPQGLQGCYTQVAVVTGSVTSNFTSMPIDPNGAACTDSDGVSLNYVNGLISSKGFANVGVIGLRSQFWNTNLTGDIVPMVNDTVIAQIGKFTPAPLELFRGFTDAPSLNNCSVNTYLGNPPPADAGLGYVTYLDAGGALSIQGPVNSLGMQSVPKVQGLGYFGVVGGTTPDNALNDDTWPLPAFFWLSTANGDGTYTVTTLSSGNYMVSAPGGADVPAFSATLDLSPAAASLQWTNSGTFNDPNGSPTISRNTPLNITWSGGDPAGYVDITLIGTTAQFTIPIITSPEPGVQVECIVPNSLGSFNVPTYVLQTLPPRGNSGSVVQGLVTVGPVSAPVKISPTPTGLDALYMYFRFIQGYTVYWQ